MQSTAEFLAFAKILKFPHVKFYKFFYNKKPQTFDRMGKPRLERERGEGGGRLSAVVIVIQSSAVNGVRRLVSSSA